MLIATHRAACLAVVVLAACVGCSSSASGPTGDTFIPRVVGFYRDVNMPPHTLTITSADSGKASGAFTGTETLPGAATSPLSGTFDRATATVTITRSTGAVTYDGRFIAPDTLRLVRTGETLNFLRY